MNKNIFRYIWNHSRREQLFIFAVVLASLPFYFVSLDLPRKIVNEAIQGKAFEKGQETASFLELSFRLPDAVGGRSYEIFEGFHVGRLELLYGLSFVFLGFVLINGWFKYYINVSKGALGERMMRRMRFELFSYALRFTPETLRTVKSSEAATIIKDEVEPIGGFIGDAFIQPLFLGTQAATALAFILLQSVWLGLIAAGIVGVQFVVIPRMRRELLRLGRRRQIASRRLAGRIGEVLDGIEAVHVHDTARWERAEIGNRLYELFDIRYKIFKRKFVVKFLNNLLAQMTPFFFYAVGGYFALRGRLDIGQLVAVIAAYRDLPPPLKELIDWDQQRLDVQVKYDQVVGYFALDKLLPLDEPHDVDTSDEPLTGTLTARDFIAFDGHGGRFIDGASFEIELPACIALLGDGSLAPSAFARILAGRSDDFQGELKIGERDLSRLSGSIVGRRIAYASVDPILFPGSLRDNLVYGLRAGPQVDPETNEAERQRITEAKWTGNPIDNADVDWLDLGHVEVPEGQTLDDLLIGLLKRAGFEDDLYRFGLSGMVEPEKQPELAERIVEARERIRERLVEQGMDDLVEPFDPDRYCERATVAENLLFGVPTSRDLLGRALAEDPGFRQALDKAELTDELVAMGETIASEMIDIFRGLPPGHPLFEQFSFINADELDEVEAMTKRRRVRGGHSRDDRTRLLALPLSYVEPRHRLGLLDDAKRERLLEGRRKVREMLESMDEPGVDFYEPHELCPAAPVRDNLFFGRVNESIADARDQVRKIGATVIDEFALRGGIEQVGLDHQVGPAGRLLTAQQRASVNLIRCLVKQPDILVVDGALSPFGEARAETMLRLLIELTGERTLVVVVPNERRIGLFQTVLRFSGTEVTVGAAPDETATDGSPALSDGPHQDDRHPAEPKGSEGQEGPDAEMPAEEAPVDAPPPKTEPADAPPGADAQDRSGTPGRRDDAASRPGGDREKRPDATEKSVRPSIAAE